MPAAQPVSRRRRAPSPALVIAMLALVLALGGTGYATTQTAGSVKLVYEYSSHSIAPHAEITLDVACPSGTRPSGGGFQTTPATAVAVLNSGPLDRTRNQFAGGSDQAANAWSVTLDNFGATAATGTADAVCAAG